MALWTDVVDPAELTGYARASLADYEANKGTLARWLPNRFLPDIVARFTAGSNGLVPTAEFRSYDAETPIGAGPTGERKTVELPPLGQKIRVSEYDQLRQRGVGDDDERMLTTFDRSAERVARAVSDRIERLRGAVISSGSAVINENGFVSTANYGRSGTHTITVSKLWSASDATPLTDLRIAADLYRDDNGEDPGALVLSNRALVALQQSAEFRALAATTAGTPNLVSRDAVQSVLSAFGLPPIVVYDRRVRVGNSNVRVTPDAEVYLLPAPVDPDDEDGTDLGGTFWGQTLESIDPRYGIEPGEEPGVVVGLYRDDDPLAVWVRSNAIGLPVLANANLSVKLTVLA